MPFFLFYSKSESVKKSRHQMVQILWAYKIRAIGGGSDWKIQISDGERWEAGV